MLSIIKKLVGFLTISSIGLLPGDFTGDSGPAGSNSLINTSPSSIHNH